MQMPGRENHVIRWAQMQGSDRIDIMFRAGHPGRIRSVTTCRDEDRCERNMVGLHQRSDIRKILTKRPLPIGNVLVEERKLRPGLVLEGIEPGLRALGPARSRPVAAGW